MFHGTILCVQRSEAIRCAAQKLAEMGLHITYTAAPDVTHMLLPIPSFPTGDEYLAHILTDLPDGVIISGGNLYSSLLTPYHTIDFLQDPDYLAENAAITAKCAMQIVKEKLSVSLRDCPVLVLGWGRIGKCLCRLLQQAGADVTCAARKSSDRAMLHALGCRGISIEEARLETSRYQVILNTIPAMVLPVLTTQPEAVILELASKPGMCGEHIVDARGLPGKMAPAESGELIARTFLRLVLEKEA